MTNEVTSKEYWEEYWGIDEIKHSQYNLKRGAFNSYKLLLDKCFADVRARTQKQTLAVADCGCGEGLILRLLAEQFSDLEVWGIEYSDAIEKAEKLAQSLNLNFNLIKADLLQKCAPELEAKFDVIMSLGLIEHFEEPEIILARMQEMLAPGGAMVSIIPNFQGLFRVLWSAYDSDNYAYHIPISNEKLARIHRGIGLDSVEIYQLGPPTVPGIHNPGSIMEKSLQSVIRLINGRLLRKAWPAQRSLSSNFRMAPSVGCIGFVPPR